MRRQEFPHHTREQIVGYLDDAVGIVAEVEPPAELREAAFTQAVALLAAKQIVFEQVAPAGVIDLGGMNARH